MQEHVKLRFARRKVSGAQVEFAQARGTEHVQPGGRVGCHFGRQDARRRGALRDTLPQGVDRRVVVVGADGHPASLYRTSVRHSGKTNGRLERRFESGAHRTTKGENR